MKIIVEVSSGCVVAVWISPGRETLNEARVLDWDDIRESTDVAALHDQLSRVRELADMTDIL